MTETISVTIPQGLRKKIDSLRGDVSRSRFIAPAHCRQYCRRLRNEISMQCITF